MKTWGRPLLTKITVLSYKPGYVRIVISCAKINQPGVFIMFLAGEDLAVDAGACLRSDISPGVGGVADLDAAVRIRQIDSASKGVVMVVLNAGAGVQAEQAIRIAVMGQQASISGVALLQYGFFIIEIVHVAAFAVPMTDAEAECVVVVMAEDNSSAGRVSGGLDELIEGVFCYC